MSQLLCPACGSLINDSANMCPCCGLKNLNQIFINQAARNAWKAAELEPFIEKLTPKIFVGKNNALFLTHKGELYGVGKNDKHQLSYNDELWFDIPVHLARNVKSAAVGLDYVIWVDKTGKVNLQGSGEYIDLFKGFYSAEKVLADPSENIFWLIDIEGVVRVFGNNFNGILFPLTEQKISLGEYIATVKFEKNFRTHGSSGNETYYTNNEDSTVQDVKHKFEEISKYTALLKMYGRKNVELEVNEDKSKRKLLSGDSLTAQERTEERLFQGYAIIKNLQLTHPVKTSLTEDEIKIPLRKPQPFSSSAGLLEYHKHYKINDVKGSLYEVIATYVQKNGNIFVALTRDNKILFGKQEKINHILITTWHAIPPLPKEICVYAMKNGFLKFIERTSFYIR